MPRKAKNREEELRRLIDEQTRESHHRYITPEIITFQGGALLRKLTTKQIACVVLSGVIGRRQTAKMIGLKEQGVKKSVRSGLSRLNGEEVHKLRGAIRRLKYLN